MKARTLTIDSGSGVPYSRKESASVGHVFLPGFHCGSRQLKADSPLLAGSAHEEHWGCRETKQGRSQIGHQWAMAPCSYLCSSSQGCVSHGDSLWSFLSPANGKNPEEGVKNPQTESGGKPCTCWQAEPWWVARAQTV